RCHCATCATFSRAYLAHLFRSKEMLGPRLLSYHNLYLVNALMCEARAAIEAREWKKFRGNWGHPSTLRQAQGRLSSG
ncbi:MAG: tRNA-guanine transglycosylase, partial [Candidatus Cybelea sp.]